MNVSLGEKGKCCKSIISSFLISFSNYFTMFVADQNSANYLSNGIQSFSTLKVFLNEIDTQPLIF